MIGAQIAARQFLNRLRHLRPNLPMHPKLIALLALGMPIVLLATGCSSSGPTQAGSVEQLRLTLISFASIPEDTIAAPVPGGLVVQVTNSAGVPQPGVKVIFSSRAVQPDRPNPRPDQLPFICFAQWGDAGCVTKSLTTLTDASGMASTPVIRGIMSGTLDVVATTDRKTPEIRIGTRILPGHAYNLDSQPHDSAVYVGGSYQLRVAAVDQGGNPVRSAPRYRLVPAIAGVDANGMLTGLATGRARLEVTIDDTTIFRRVSVVPTLTLAGYDNGKLIEFGADGGGIRTLVTGIPDPSGLTWNPARTELLFAAGGLRAVNSVTGQVRSVGGVGYPWDPMWPQYSLVDGRIYLAASPLVVGYGGISIWSVNPDGTAPQQLTAPVVPGHGDWHPSVSPDGSTIVFATESQDGLTSAELAFLDLRLGTIRKTSTHGFLPRWAPDGRTIAYLGNDEVKLADPTGNELRSLTPGGSYWGGLEWSRDGRWLVTHGDSGITIIDPLSLTAMPLSFTGGFSVAVPK